MRHFFVMTVICGAATCFFLGPAATSAQQPPASTQPAPAPTPPSATALTPPPSMQNWRSTISHAPPPSTGCGSASYPSTQWTSVPCTTAPNRPYPPASGPKSETVGNGNDFVAQASGSSPITYSEGSFPDVTNVTSETGSGAAPGANTFSLQLNTNTFTTSVCTGSGCLGWQQFVYSNGGVAFIQYWLLNYGAACPSGWNTYTSGYCWRNGPNAASVPVQTITSLAQMTLAGTAQGGGTDTVVVTVTTTSGTSAYTAGNPDNILNLAQGWTASEFNVFGDGGGSQAVFNSGSTIDVMTSVFNGSANTPTAGTTGTTGETNNLTLVQPACAIAYSPAIVFAESNATGASTPCPSGSWHTDDVSAETNAAPATGDPACYVFNAQGTQHVMFRGADNDIHELYYSNGQWSTDDVSSTTKAPAAASNPTGYMFNAQGTQHVMFRGADNDIHELYYSNGQWSTDDLTSETGAPSAVGNPSGYMFDAQGTQHVMYRGTDNDIHELYWSNGKWSTDDVTTQANANTATQTKAPPAASDPSAYMYDAQGTQHVMYVGTDGDVHELYWYNGQWYTDDVTTQANANTATQTKAPPAVGNPSGYVFNAQGTQHVMYRGTDNDIHEFYYNNGQWYTDDVSSTTKAPAAAGDPNGYMFDAQGTQHVMYRGADNDIHELYYSNGQWSTDDPTKTTSATSATGDPRGYVFFVQGTQHVMYVGTDGHIHELWWG
jgi:hypothetical protein